MYRKNSTQEQPTPLFSSRSHSLRTMYSPLSYVLGVCYCSIVVIIVVRLWHHPLSNDVDVFPINKVSRVGGPCFRSTLVIPMSYYYSVPFCLDTTLCSWQWTMLLTAPADCTCGRGAVAAAYGCCILWLLCRVSSISSVHEINIKNKMKKDDGWIIRALIQSVRIRPAWYALAVAVYETVWLLHRRRGAD